MQSVLEAIPGVETAREEFCGLGYERGFCRPRRCGFAGRCVLNRTRCACLVDYYCCYISALHL